MSLLNKVPGIHIQWPWTDKILSGEKVIETRRYPLPGKYLNKVMAIIETSGKRGLSEKGITRAQIIGTIVFGECFLYKDLEDWKSDFERHLVSLENSELIFKPDKPTWGWPILAVEEFKIKKPAPQRRGIIYATVCEL